MSPVSRPCNSSHDPSANWFFLAAPGKFLGNQSAAYGNSLQFDLFDISGPQVSPYLNVMLVGAGLKAFYISDAPGGLFHSYNLAFDPSLWLVGVGQNGNTVGITATPAQLQAILGSLDGLYIDGDWANGDDLAGLDNVRMSLTDPAPSALPEPASLMLIFSGTVAGLGLYRRRFSR